MSYDDQHTFFGFGQILLGKETAILHHIPHGHIFQLAAKVKTCIACGFHCAMAHIENAIENTVSMR